MTSRPRPSPPFVAQYRRIEADLRERVRSGRWHAGAMLPSRRDLADEYQVSSVTIGRAVDALVAEGLLRSDSRRGTFVAPPSAPAAPSDAPPRPTATGTMVVGVAAALEESASGSGQSVTILHALEHALADGGHVSTVRDRTRPGGLAPLPETIEALLRDGVDALVVICFDLDRVQIEETLSRIDFGGIPLVCVLAGDLLQPIPHVFYDNRIAGHQAARHLLDAGFRPLTVFAPFTATWVSERIAGIRHAAGQAHREPCPVTVMAGDAQPWDYFGDPTVAGGRAAEMALASGWEPGGGVIAINDQVAHGVMHALSQRTGAAPGRDYALIGFDDERCARTDGLTTLRPPLEAMGREAARLLIEEARGAQVSHQLRLRAHLIPRASTHARPPASAGAGLALTAS